MGCLLITIINDSNHQSHLFLSQFFFFQSSFYFVSHFFIINFHYFSNFENDRKLTAQVHGETFFQIEFCSTDGALIKMVKTSLFFE